MTLRGVLPQYVALGRIPGAARLLLVGVVARLGTGMTPLALVLLVEGATGRYAAAGLVTACYALAGALAGPVAGRLADLVGPARVLQVTAFAHPAGLVALLVAAHHGAGALPLVCVASAAAGATYPPVTAAVRSTWSRVTSAGLRASALAAETALFELVFVVGPLLVSGFVLVATPAVAIAAVAGVTCLGTMLVARSPLLRDRTSRPARMTRGVGPLRVPGFLALLVCVGCLGVAFGVVAVAIPAASGPAEEAGVLLAAWAVGSGVGGAWYGARPPGVPLGRQFLWLLGATAVSLGVLAVLPHPVALGVGLLVGGVVIAPTLTVYTSIVGRLVPGQMLNEANTWLAAVPVAANSLGGALCGVVVDWSGGVGCAFLVAAAVALMGAVTAAIGGRRF